MTVKVETELEVDIVNKDKSPYEGVILAVSHLVVGVLEENRRNGQEISIPSLGIIINGKNGFHNEHLSGDSSAISNTL